MINLRGILIGLIATVLLASGIARGAIPANGQPACHATTGQHETPRPTPHHASIATMNCCLGCLLVPSLGTQMIMPTIQQKEPFSWTSISTQEGRSLVPELGPPRA